jgi:hypothetical protein
LFGEDTFKRGSEFGVVIIKITIFILHVVFLNGAEVWSFCERSLSSIFVAVAFVGVNSALIWCGMFESF